MYAAEESWPYIAMVAAQAANGSAQNRAAAPDVNAAGQPDTPVEVVTALLGKALESGDHGSMKQLVQQAHAVLAGLDPYLDSISTPPSEVRRVSRSGLAGESPAVCQCLWYSPVRTRTHTTARHTAVHVLMCAGVPGAHQRIAVAQLAGRPPAGDANPMIQVPPRLPQRYCWIRSSTDGENDGLIARGWRLHRARRSSCRRRSAAPARWRAAS
jgi:hypothetical protein